MSQRYELTNYSSPVSVMEGEDFTILITPENSFHPRQRVSCIRDPDFEQAGALFDMPLVGPESLAYTNGSFSFNLRFEGSMVRFSPWHTEGNPPKPLWHIKFYLKVDGIKVASALASVEIHI
ncbi:hypothetical protein LIA77_05491 [Sarocladium implicatum]|nr:hypothetical protein LIA77_05491 [Sarocladium implicatum]